MRADSVPWHTALGPPATACLRAERSVRPRETAKSKRRNTTLRPLTRHHPPNPKPRKKARKHRGCENEVYQATKRGKTGAHGEDVVHVFPKGGALSLGEADPFPEAAAWVGSGWVGVGTWVDRCEGKG